ncbi:hypothetical protein HZA98_04745 [Candidatus Woesearchaeota archaeon]|nr:hypothetical protein [Candidatus Woesearchaeota archaeon]
MRKGFKIILHAIFIALIGVFGIDAFFHFFFSKPMETLPYFFTKAALYLIFSLFFLVFIAIKKKEALKVTTAGLLVAGIWGAYYNILPTLFHFYPFGIALQGLTFLGIGILGTGIAFGVIHILAFIGGYYIGKALVEMIL